MNFIKSTIKAIAITCIVLITLSVIIALAMPTPDESREVMRGYQEQVANDFVEQYQMAKESGTAVDVCVRAGLVAEGYLQAGDRELYQTWKGVERVDCAAAGIVR